MFTAPRPFVSLAAAVLALAGLTGCNGDLKTQNDALWAQNEEQQSLLDAQNAELADLQSQNQRLMTQLNDLETQLQSARTPAPQPAARANTGFESIEGVTTYQTPGQISVRVPGDVLFESGKVDLKSSARQTLAQIAAVIKRQYGAQTIRVEGYTDTDPIRKSKWKDNLELSLERAAAVHRYLQEQGISKDRMYAAGFGETHPQSTKAQSRRVEIVVVTAP